MPDSFAEQNFIVYNETAIKHVLHMVETESSVILAIFLWCYTIKVHELFLRR